MARTGTAWRDLHSHFGEWNSVYRQFRRWTLAGTWEVMLEALNKAGAGHGSVQMIEFPPSSAPISTPPAR